MFTFAFDYGSLPLQWGVVIGASLVAAAWDAARQRIPNLLTGPIWLTGIAWSTWTAGGAGLAESLAGCLLMAAPYLLLFVFAGGGAGDVKLMGALGAWLGIANGAIALVAVSLSGIFVAMAFAVARGQGRLALASVKGVLGVVWLRVLGEREAVPMRLHYAPVARNNPLAFPYGVAVFAGTVLAGAGVILWRL